MCVPSRIVKARFVDTESPEEEWQQIHAIADRNLATVADLFDGAVAAMQARVDLQALRRSVETGTLVAGVFDELAFMEHLIPVHDIFVGVAFEAAAVSARVLGEEIAPDFMVKAHALIVEVEGGGVATAISATPFEGVINTNATAALADEWAAVHGAEWVTDVSTSTRQGINVLIRRAFREQLSPRKLAKKLRGLRSRLGLTAQQMTALANYEAAQSAAGVTGSLLRQRVQAMQARLFRQRTITIARHELMSAGSRGQELLWEQADQQALLPKGRTFRVWIVTPDDRLCRLCAPMEGKETPLGQPWITPTGKVVQSPQEIHIQCRCSQRLRFDRREGTLAT